MTESQDLFDPTQVNEDDLINDLLNEENVDDAPPKPEEPAQVEEQAESSPEKAVTEKSAKFPLARIKTLMKMDPDLELVSQEAIYLVARATELFLKNLAQETYTYTAKAKRKTVQKRDLEAAVENIDALCFLEGALD